MNECLIYKETFLNAARFIASGWFYIMIFVVGLIAGAGLMISASKRVGLK